MKNWMIALSVSFAVAGSSLSGPVVLVKDGRPNGSILIETGAPDSIRHAARELRDYW